MVLTVDQFATNGFAKRQLFIIKLAKNLSNDRRLENWGRTSPSAVQYPESWVDEVASTITPQKPGYYRWGVAQREFIQHLLGTMGILQN